MVVSSMATKEQDKDNRGISPSTPGQTENAQPKRLGFNSLILKGEFLFNQLVADSLTKAGLGPHSFTVAEEPREDSEYVLAAYVGEPDRETLWNLINRAKETKRELERQGISKKKIDEILGQTIRNNVELELRRETHFNPRLDSIRKKPA